MTFVLHQFKTLPAWYEFWEKVEFPLFPDQGYFSIWEIQMQPFVLHVVLQIYQLHGVRQVCKTKVSCVPSILSGQICRIQLQNVFFTVNVKRRYIVHRWLANTYLDFARPENPASMV
jgi:hypothetical protein